MRPDIDPGTGELGLLALLVTGAWSLWAWQVTRGQPAAETDPTQPSTSTTTHHRPERPHHDRP